MPYRLFELKLIFFNYSCYFTKYFLLPSTSCKTTNRYKAKKKVKNKKSKETKKLRSVHFLRISVCS